MATYLDKILAAHRARPSVGSAELEADLDRARAMPPCRGFRRALAEADGLGVISEVKRRSPSKGEINPGVEVDRWVQGYASGGATCLSVLTDEEFFGGSADDLATARAAVGLPVLRKDFTVSLHDVCSARLMGADAVLLIVAALDDGELRDFHALASDLGLDVLVEAHDEAEVERALAVGADLVGVNQRDLTTFEVDQARAVRVASSLPPEVVRVAESGVGGVDDARPLHEAGYHAVLVGESLMRSGDPAAAVAALRAIR